MAAPVSAEDLAERLGELRVGAVVHGVRGGPAGDLAAFHDLVTAVVELVASDPTLAEVELNPVLVDAVGCGVRLVDALVARSAPIHAHEEAAR
jgi:hypothetical protein